MLRRCRLPGKNAGGTKCCRAVVRARRVSRAGGFGSRGGGTSKGGEAESQRGEMSAAGKGVVWERNSTFLQPDGFFLTLKYNNKASLPVQHFLWQFLSPAAIMIYNSMIILHLPLSTGVSCRGKRLADSGPDPSHQTSW